MSAPNSIERLGQTYRTILFEEVNKDYNANLKLALSNPQLVDTPEKLQRELEELEVHSFQEFMDKFKPSIYEYCTRDDNTGAVNIEYSTKKPEGILFSTHEITSLQYFKMIDEMYMKKGSSGTSNLKFDASELFKMMMPQKEVEEARGVRSQLEYAVRKMNEAEKKGENANLYKKQIISLRKDIIRKYKQSKSALLPLAIHDAEVKLLQLDTKVPTETKSPDGKEPLKLTYGNFSFNETGDLVLAEESAIVAVGANNNDNESNNSNKVNTAIESYIQKDFDANQKNEKESPFIKNLIVSVYSANNNNTLALNDQVNVVELRDKIQQQKEMYEQIYSNAQNNLVKTISEMIEKIMGIKIFFDHATSKGGTDGKLDYPVLITNCKVGDLISSGTKDAFTKFIKNRASETGENKYWFAVIPGVLTGNESSEKELDMDDAVTIDISEDEDEKENHEGVTLNDVKDIIPILAEGQITTIFNVKASEDTGFLNVTADKIEEYKTYIEGIEKKYASYGVFAYPNFTILSEKNIDLSTSDESKSESNLKFPGIYIDASYVAAGLLVASQQPKFLEEHGFKGRVIKENVCTRVDLEDEELKRPLMTKMNRETSFNWSDEVVNAIKSDRFGFVFCSDRIYNNEEVLKNTYVYYARNLRKKGNGKYEPIYRCMMRTFVEQYTRTNGRDITLKQLKEIIEKTANEWEEQNSLKKTENSINLILRKDEHITYDEETKNIILTLSNDPDPIDFEVSDND